MSRIQLKITCCIKSEDNLNLNVKRQSADTNTEMTQMLELSDRDFKAAIMKCFKEQLQTSFKLETNEESQQKNAKYKEQSNRNFIIENYNNANKKLGSTIE